MLSATSFYAPMASMENMALSAYLSSTQAVSMLNSQKTSVFIMISSYHPEMPQGVHDGFFLLRRALRYSRILRLRFIAAVADVKPAFALHRRCIQRGDFQAVPFQHIIPDLRTGCLTALFLKHFLNICVNVDMQTISPH